MAHISSVQNENLFHHKSGSLWNRITSNRGFATHVAWHFASLRLWISNYSIVTNMCARLMINTFLCFSQPCVAPSHRCRSFSNKLESKSCVAFFIEKVLLAPQDLTPSFSRLHCDWHSSLLMEEILWHKTSEELDPSLNCWLNFLSLECDETVRESDVDRMLKAVRCIKNGSLWALEC